MGLTIKEVRNPVQTVRAERIRAALEAHGNVGEYTVAGAISPNDGVATIRTITAGMAMTLADGSILGETMLIECTALAVPGTDTVVVTPATLVGGTTITFDAAGERAVLIWVALGWSVRGGNTATVA